MTGLDPSEFTLSRALQKSNLGEFAEADRLFADALALPTSDPVQLRLRRNFRAIHALNQQDYDSAATILRAPVPPLRSEEHTSELQSLMRISYAVFCLKKTKKKKMTKTDRQQTT